jgi:hypothetical protein
MDLNNAINYISSLPPAFSPERERKSRRENGKWCYRNESRFSPSSITGKFLLLIHFSVRVYGFPTTASVLLNALRKKCLNALWQLSGKKKDWSEISSDKVSN